MNAMASTKLLNLDFCPDSKQAVDTTKWALPNLPHANSHARPVQAQQAGKGGSRLTPELMNPLAVRGPRAPNPGHGHRHLFHLAAGLRLDGYATQHEDFSVCYLNQEHPFEKTRGHPKFTCSGQHATH